LKGEEKPAYRVAKSYRIDVDLSSEVSTEELWRVHQQVLKGSQDFETDVNGVSFLDLKIELCERLLARCELCENRCGVNRLSGEVGFCGVKKTRIDTFFLHFGEEPEIVPSFTIFFTGCSFKCVYCQNHSISQHPERGKSIPPEKMAQLIEVNAGTNINWVGGDPNPHLLYILKTLKHSESKKPQIWNSNFYVTPEALNLLLGVVDVFLSDFKYGNDSCALRLSKVKDYTKVLKRNHIEGQKEIRIGDKRIRADFIIRHLVLPEHYICCSEPVILWLKENMDDPYINVMAQYRPHYRAYQYQELTKYISMEEFHRLEKLAEK